MVVCVLLRCQPEIPENVLRFSLSQDVFFHFSNIAGLYPDVSSSSDFITNYLGSLEIVFEGNANSIENLEEAIRRISHAVSTFT